MAGKNPAQAVLPKTTGGHILAAIMQREKEQEICFLMIDLYCRFHHPKGDCPQCRQLKDYVAQRLALCPYGDLKSFCSSCTSHCYQPDMQRRICAVMRFSGPRMLLHHPLVALQHLAATIAVKLTKAAGKGRP